MFVFGILSVLQHAKVIRFGKLSRQANRKSFPFWKTFRLQRYTHVQKSKKKFGQHEIKHYLCTTNLTKPETEKYDEHLRVLTRDWSALSAFQKERAASGALRGATERLLLATAAVNAHHENQDGQTGQGSCYGTDDGPQ